MSEVTFEEIAGKFLGARVGEPKAYDPNLLVAIPRNLSLEYINVKMEDLPGSGFDLWYSYEFRTLTKSGLPLAAMIKFIIPHTSKNIIESKSFKLYCNSFANEKLGETKKEALTKVCEIMKKDLSKAVGTDIDVSIVDSTKRVTVFEDYTELTTLVDPKIEVKEYNENPKLLQLEDLGEEKEYRLKFDALRSCCAITKQQDSGTVYLYYKSKKHLIEDDLIRYFSSFYSENHFHEQILITIFSRLNNLLDKDDELFVTALYQRRGSLDIGPLHYKNIKVNSEEEKIIKDLRKPNYFSFDPNNLYR